MIFPLKTVYRNTFFVLISVLGSPGGSEIKNLPAVQETQVLSLGREDPLEKEMATHSSILAWEILWTEEPGRVKSMVAKELDRTEPITSWEIDGETVETVSDFNLGGSKITADGDCSHEIKRRLLLGYRAKVWWAITRKRINSKVQGYKH